MAKKILKVMILSDGTGKTAKELMRAVATQFQNTELVYTFKKNIRLKEQIPDLFLEATVHYDLIAYTIVDKEIRNLIQEQASKTGVKVVDIMGPILDTLSESFQIKPKSEPGLLRTINDQYYRRINAIEFTLKHDDGQTFSGISEADVVLIGISRTSKTPLSVFLALEGLKVVNVPLKYKKAIPQELMEIDQRKIIALTIDPDVLQGIRENRLQTKGDKTREYILPEKVSEEVEWAQELFSDNPLWPVFDITNKSLEEVATEIVKVIEMRRSNKAKQALR